MKLNVRQPVFWFLLFVLAATAAAAAIHHVHTCMSFPDRLDGVSKKLLCSREHGENTERTTETQNNNKLIPRRFIISNIILTLEP